ncbi:MAG: purine-nucleoside phosphorylase, partial [Kiritimatiellae bacterium]|nr:purine-nucleoside phosphorylase [Kiritimatiellia bacterium]
FVTTKLSAPSPLCSIILGSGWGPVVEDFTIKQSIDYADIPHLGKTGVQGHGGHLHLAECQNGDVLIFQGRRHWYEGTGWEPIAIPVYMSAKLGAKTVLLTNAAGGIREDLKPGSLMIINDHINAMGSNPLIGIHDPIWGPRFPDQTNVYNASLQEQITNLAQSLSIPITSGVYLATSGPTYETPAEVSAFRTSGADAVGMSTVPEAILANAAGMKVAGISCITNMASGISTTPLTHEEVLQATNKAKESMGKLLTEMVSN